MSKKTREFSELSTEEFVAAVQACTAMLVRSQNLRHPVDILTTITIANETLFQFFAECLPGDVALMRRG